MWGAKCCVLLYTMISYALLTDKNLKKIKSVLSLLMVTWLYTSVCVLYCSICLKSNDVVKILTFKRSEHHHAQQSLYFATFPSSQVSIMGSDQTTSCSVSWSELRVRLNQTMLRVGTFPRMTDGCWHGTFIYSEFSKSRKPLKMICFCWTSFLSLSLWFSLMDSSQTCCPLVSSRTTPPDSTWNTVTPVMQRITAPSSIHNHVTRVSQPTPVSLH